MSPPVHDSKRGRIAQGPGPAPQKNVAQGMEGAAGNTGASVPDQVRGPAQHFRGGLAGKGQQQHGFGRHTVFDQIGDPVNQCPRLARPGAGHAQDRPLDRGHGLVLRWIELFFKVHAGQSVFRGLE